MRKAEASTTNGIGGFQITIMLLSLYVLAAMAVDATVQLPEETCALLNKIDTLVCFVFLGDFAYRFYRAENRLGFMRWGWIDLISSIPALDALRWGRLVRLIRILRILRGVRSANVILQALSANRAKGTFGAVVTISAMLMICSSIGILIAEKTPEANIKSSGDALWWAATTITTVGYGDKYPVTPEGRVVGAILMTAGVGLFGTFTAYVATFFIGGEKPPEPQSEVIQELRSLRERLASLENKLTDPVVHLPAQFGSPPTAEDSTSAPLSSEK